MSIGWRSEHCHDAGQPGGFDAGDEPVLVNEVAANFESLDAYQKKLSFTWVRAALAWQQSITARGSRKSVSHSRSRESLAH
jgi:hypothetical protein